MSWRMAEEANSRPKVATMVVRTDSGAPVVAAFTFCAAHWESQAGMMPRHLSASLSLHMSSMVSSLFQPVHTIKSNQVNSILEGKEAVASGLVRPSSSSISLYRFGESEKKLRNRRATITGY